LLVGKNHPVILRLLEWFLFLLFLPWCFVSGGDFFPYLGKIRMPLAGLRVSVVFLSMRLNAVPS